MKLFIALTAAAVLTTPAFSAPCKDAKGKFMKCPAASAPASSGITKGKDGKCRDTKGHFAKCPK
ncbi:hypothetical protein HL653_03650 [Sphingomonas sp. AP4-R1]|uniref:hypothetical protein n=1 Tax=Sphingomonas sp. AP4-R1 TaxID=2735134 RepID=UPI0014938058|nr:hypothetical protein [Sphingomonas sp. AP4-R1]QJU57001.1 hypothetical protein HL653_03650 [Sphingomonas sp. AP4-R1]